VSQCLKPTICSLQADIQILPNTSFTHIYVIHAAQKKTEISLDNLKTCKFEDNGLEDVTH